MAVPESFLQEVRDANEIVSLIENYVELKRSGATYSCRCPFHSERTPSFHVYPNTQSYYCFGCGAGGDAITFIRTIENLDYIEAVRFLAQRAGLPMPEDRNDDSARRRQRLYEMNREAGKFFHRQLFSPEGADGWNYITGRQLTEHTIRHFGIGYAVNDYHKLHYYMRNLGFSEDELVEGSLLVRNNNRVYDKFVNRVMFPIFDTRGNIIAYGGRALDPNAPAKYLNSSETYVFQKRDNLFALNYAKNSKADYFILCEGYMDVISMHQAGYTNAVASLGTALTEQHAALLKRYTDQVILTYDSDGAGVKAALRAIPILKRAGISTKVLNMRPYKDPDEFMKNLGAEEFEKRIETARNSFLYEIDVLKAGFDMEDPEQKTKFYQETAKKLLQFGEPLERDNYIQAVSREQMIKEEELRQLVNRLGMQMGLKAGDSYREDASGRSVISRENGSGPGNDMGRPEYGGNPYEGQAAQSQAAIKKTGRKQEREDGIRRSQRLLLTWLIENPALFDKIKGIITADDFVEDLYHQVAVMVFEGHEAGNVNPAGILSRFINDEDQYKEVAALFNASLKESLNNEEQKKAFAETVMKVRKNSLDTASRNAKDIAQLQEIIKQQAALKQLHISLD